MKAISSIFGRHKKAQFAHGWVWQSIFLLHLDLNHRSVNRSKKGNWEKGAQHKNIVKQFMARSNPAALSRNPIFFSSWRYVDRFWQAMQSQCYDALRKITWQIPKNCTSISKISVIEALLCTFNMYNFLPSIVLIQLQKCNTSLHAQVPKLESHIKIFINVKAKLLFCPYAQISPDYLDVVKSN